MRIGIVDVSTFTSRICMKEILWALECTCLREQSILLNLTSTTNNELPGDSGDTIHEDVMGSMAAIHMNAAAVPWIQIEFVRDTIIFEPQWKIALRFGTVGSFPMIDKITPVVQSRVFFE